METDASISHMRVIYLPTGGARSRDRGVAHRGTGAWGGVESSSPPTPTYASIRQQWRSATPPECVCSKEKEDRHLDDTKATASFNWSSAMPGTAAGRHWPSLLPLPLCRALRCAPRVSQQMSSRSPTILVLHYRHSGMPTVTNAMMAAACSGGRRATEKERSGTIPMSLRPL